MKSPNATLLPSAPLTKTPIFTPAKTKSQAAPGSESTFRPVSWSFSPITTSQPKESESPEANSSSASSWPPLFKVLNMSNTMKKSNQCWTWFWAKDNFTRLSTWSCTASRLELCFTFAVKWNKTRQKYWIKTFRTGCATARWTICGKRQSTGYRNSSRWLGPCLPKSQKNKK